MSTGGGWVEELCVHVCKISAAISITIFCECLIFHTLHAINYQEQTLAINYKLASGVKSTNYHHVIYENN